MYGLELIKKDLITNYSLSVHGRRYLVARSEQYPIWRYLPDISEPLDEKKRYPTKGVGVSESSGESPVVQCSFFSSGLSSEEIYFKCLSKYDHTEPSKACGP